LVRRGRGICVKEKVEASISLDGVPEEMPEGDGLKKV